jgi:threonine/homoserine efflux transporter RhtA
MNRLVTWLIVAIIALCLLVSAGPTLVRLAHAAVSLIAVLGIVVVVLRLVWYFTERY